MMRQGRRKKYNRNRFTILCIVILCVVLCSTVTYKRAILKAQSVRYENQVDSLKKQVKSETLRKADLKKFKRYVKTNKYIESVARDKLGLVYQGEIIFEPSDSN